MFAGRERALTLEISAENRHCDVVSERREDDGV